MMVSIHLLKIHKFFKEYYMHLNIFHNNNIYRIMLSFVKFLILLKFCFLFGYYFILLVFLIINCMFSIVISKFIIHKINYYCSFYLIIVLVNILILMIFNSKFTSLHFIHFDFNFIFLYKDFISLNRINKYYHFIFSKY